MISVVTVNYKSHDVLKTMLSSLFQHHDPKDVEVFVVNNDPQDDLSFVTSFPNTVVIENEQNLGFATACNQGIKQSKGEFVVLVNPDVSFSSPALTEVAREMRKMPTVGIGGISLKNADGSQQNCVWRFPTPIDQLMVLLKIPHLLGPIGPVGRWISKDFNYTSSADVDQVMGAFFCIRREVLDQIGLLDEMFFIWYEEVDYCRRAKTAGWSIRYFAEIEATHHGGHSFSKVGTWKKQGMVRKSLRRYMRKHWGVKGWLLFVVFEPALHLIAILASIIKRK